MNLYRLEERYVYGTDEMDALRRFSLDCDYTDLIPIAANLTEAECEGLIQVSIDTNFESQVRRVFNMLTEAVERVRVQVPRMAGKTHYHKILSEIERMKK